MSEWTIAAIGAALCLFIVLGLRHRATQGLDDYLTARSSQSAIALGLSFLASGMGAWILFAPPEIGAFIGPVAVAGYALGSALPFIVLGYAGPAIRARLPAGRSLTEFAAERFGPAFRRGMLVLSVLYMLCFLAAELTAVGAITQMLAGDYGAYAIIAVALTTLIYTAIGGLPASLATDRWQGILLIALLALCAIAIAGIAPDQASLAASAQAAPPGPSAPSVATALGVALTLVIAVTAANLFHQGYWQRVWAARDTQQLRWGAIIGGGSTVVVVMLLGATGWLAGAWGIPFGSPPMPLFALINAAPAWLALPVLLLAITLVASSIDTLQNALVSLGVTENARIGLRGARWLSALLMLPVVLIALQQTSVLRLFLIADLLCATSVIPLLSGLIQRVPAKAAIAGSLAGLFGAVAPGVIQSGSVSAGVWAATFPDAIPTLGPFAGALIASGVVTALVTWQANRRGLAPR